MDKIKKYKHYRDTTIADMTTLVNLADQAKKDKTRKTLFKVRYADISNIYDEFVKQHGNLITALLSADGTTDIEAENVIRQGFFDDYYSVKAIYSELFDDVQIQGAHNSTMIVPANTAVTSNIRLPRIELSKFDGDYKIFSSFLDQFNAMVHDNISLSNIEKFNYLLASLKGPPASLVRTLPLSSDNYTIAYDTLVKRYSNKRLRAQAHWSEIENCSKISSDNFASLRKLLDTFSENLAALKVLKYPVDEWDFILTMMLLKRLDNATVTRFEMEHRSSDMPTYDKLKTFLNNECMALDTLQSSPANTRNVRMGYQKPLSGSPRTTTLFVTKPPARSPTYTCIYCNDDHSLYTCTAFASKSPSERHSFCKNRHLCFNCLSSSHDLKSCRSTYKCKKCQSRFHHTLLCAKGDARSPTLESGTGNVRPTTATPPSDSIRNDCSQNSNANSLFAATGVIDLRKNNVLLSTAWIDICDSRGNYQPFRCLLDSGSMISFITKKAISKLGLKKSSISIEVKGLDAMQSTVNNGLVQLILKPLKQDSLLMFTDAIILNKICDNLPATSLPHDCWRHIQNLELADPTFYKPGNIDVLLGADIFSKVLLNDSIPGNADDPIAIKTILGYILMGRINFHKSPSVSSFFCNVIEESSLETAIKKFWEIESVPGTDFQDPENVVCEQIFSNTVFRDETGKYTVSLPFRENNPVFPGMRNFALSRFYSLERRLLKEPEIYSQYSEFMNEYIQLNHMEIIEKGDIPDCSYYLVHHCVLKPDSLSTKLRVVFNASAKIPNRKSLNECLMAGPKLQQDICHILLNFRLFPYVLCSDISKMYRMIWVEPAQQDYQRILWRFSPQEEVKDYRLRTLTYGLTPSPYLSLKCLAQLCQDEGKEYPLATNIIKNCSYIDDFVFSAPTFEEAYETRNQLMFLMQKGGFELRKWSSNDSALLADLPESYLSHKPVAFPSDSNEPSLKVLGLQWNPSRDYFSFNVNPRDKQTCTKRVMLSELARVYDPMGFIAPVTFFTKHLIQRLWTAGIGWDDLPSNEIVLIWQQYMLELPLLSQLRIPRLVNPFDSASYELHGFCDASEKGYACIVYVRTIRKNDEISVNFLASKTKVASHKTRLTIARLELCAMVLLAKLMSFVIQSIDGKIQLREIFAWSDSQIALHWIKGSPHQWKTFVANRVSFIKETVPLVIWQYINTKYNPSDIASRGMLPSAFLAHEYWFSGPPILHETILLVPSLSPTLTPPIEEEKKYVFFVASPTENFIEKLLNTNSTFFTVQRIVSYILRFISNSKKCNDKRSGSLEVSELQSALVLLVKFTQQTHFAQELENKTFSRPLRKLDVFLDDQGILRVGGRLQHANLTYNAKHPFLLKEIRCFSRRSRNSSCWWTSPTREFNLQCQTSFSTSASKPPYNFAHSALSFKIFPLWFSNYAVFNFPNILDSILKESHKLSFVKMCSLLER